MDGAGAGVGVVLASMVGKDFNLSSSLPLCQGAGSHSSYSLLSPNDHRLHRMCIARKYRWEGERQCLGAVLMTSRCDILNY